MGILRTAQLDAVVGHNDSAAHPTHFIFINLHGQIQIIEIQGGDAAKLMSTLVLPFTVLTRTVFL